MPEVLLKLFAAFPVATKHDTKSQLLHSVSNDRFRGRKFARRLAVSDPHIRCRARTRVLCVFADGESGRPATGRRLRERQYR